MKKKYIFKNSIKIKNNYYLTKRKKMNNLKLWKLKKIKISKMIIKFNKYTLKRNINYLQKFNKNKKWILNANSKINHKINNNIY